MEVKLTDDNIGWLPAKLAHDPLKAGLLADLGGAVHILNWEERTEAKEENLGEGGHQLGLGGDREYLRCFYQTDSANLGDDHVDAVRPALYQLEALEREVQPLVGGGLEVGGEGNPLLALVRAQQTTHIVSWGEILFI